MTLIAAIVCVSIPDLTMIMSNVPFFNYMLIFQVPGIDLFLKKVFLPCCTDLSMHPLFFTAGLGSCSIFGIIIFYEMIAKKLYHFFSNLFLKNVKTQALYILQIVERVMHKSFQALDSLATIILSRASSTYILFNQCVSLVTR